MEGSLMVVQTYIDAPTLQCSNMRMAILATLVEACPKSYLRRQRPAGEFTKNSKCLCPVVCRPRSKDSGYQNSFWRPALLPTTIPPEDEIIPPGSFVVDSRPGRAGRRGHLALQPPAPPNPHGSLPVRRLRSLARPPQKCGADRISHSMSAISRNSPDT